MSAAEIFDDIDDEVIAALAPPDSMSDGWRVRDDTAAEWALKVIARHERRAAAFVQLAEVEADVLQARLDRVRERITAARDKCAADTANLRALLEGYHRDLLDAEPKRKTVTLPSGELVARKAPDRVVVVDLEAFKVWAQSVRPDLLRVKVDPDLPAVKRLAHDGDRVLEAGEVVPGIQWETGDVTFRVQTGGGS